jgi:cytochrome c biogenesis protein CcmG/thiol:disulfide interchange protein DsbE
MTRWVVGVLGLSALALLWVLAVGFGKDPHAVPFKLRGQAAPDFDLPTVGSHDRVRLSSLRGKPVVLNFWATWCGPCAQEEPVLAWGAERFGRDVQFLGVVFEDTEESARRFLDEYGAPFPNLFDARSKVAVEFGASGVPETYFIDAQGRIVDKHLGAIDEDSLASGIERLTGRKFAREGLP